MRVKTYVVDNIRTANTTITRDLGAEAVIISTRPLGDGRYEIIAASEGHAGSAGGASLIKANGPRPERPLATTRSDENVARLDTRQPNAVSSGRKSMMPEVLRQTAFILHNRGLDMDTALDFVADHVRGWEKNPYPVALLDDAVKRSVCVMDGVADGVHFFVGYPGEGKSSTIMKVAHLLKEQGRLVAVLSYDHTKIAAGEEMDRFCQWSGIGFARMDNPEDLQNLRREGLVCLVDTPGNPKDNRLLQAVGRDDHVHLVYDPSRQKIPDGFWSELPGKHFIALTKTDFLDAGGRILLASLQAGGRPMSFISDGPRVPDNIILPTQDTVCSRITGTTQKRKSWIRRIAEKSF